MGVISFFISGHQNPGFIGPDSIKPWSLSGFKEQGYEVKVEVKRRHAVRYLIP